MSDTAITPKTKVLELIEAFPQLEDVLIDYVPAFEKLKNPVLRWTVGRITSLQQAAAVGCSSGPACPSRPQRACRPLERSTPDSCSAHGPKDSPAA